MLISIADYARQRGVTYQAVRGAIQRGLISPPVDGLLDPEVADREWAVNRRRAPNVVDTTPPAPAGTDLASNDLPSLEASRRRREFHEANIASMRERQKAGELVELAQVHLAYTTLAAQFRTALERIPDKLAPRLAAVGSDSNAVHELLSAELEQALLDMGRLAETLPDRFQTSAKTAAAN